MSDMGDDFRAWNAAKAAKRAKNRAESTSLLQKEGIEFESRNDGAHLIIHHAKLGHINFWPGTGKFQTATGAGRGVFKLIKLVKKL